MTHVVVLADTHVRPGSARRLPQGVFRELDRADVILHAGDVTSPELLVELARIAPVHAVLGNNDQELIGALPETVELDLGGVVVAMIHDSGARKGRPARLHRHFPAAQLIVFGHSHQPTIEPGIQGQLLCNPGSPTWKRKAKAPTIAILELEAGVIKEARLVEV